MRPGAWIAGIGAVALAFAAGRWTAPMSEAGEMSSGRPSSATVSPPSQRTSEGIRDCTPADGSSLKLLERCTRQFSATRARLAACRSVDAPDPDSSTAADARAACLRRPDVLDACRTRFAPPGADTDGAPDSARTGSSAATKAGPEFARRFATGVVGTTDDEADWVEDYLCSVHRLRETMVEDLDDLLERGAEAAEVDEVIARARADREAVLEDLEHRLGVDRYARLRAVGGLGLMGSALECPPA